MNLRLRSIAIAAILSLVGFAGGSAPVFAANSPNVLFIICDDLNDTVYGLGYLEAVKSVFVSD